jgi:hypothetical protein
MNTPAEQAARCRRLAAEVPDDPIAAELLALAEAFEAASVESQPAPAGDAGNPVEN